MKGQKTNAFQLTIAGAVLVLVLVCATFAWFAVGDRAVVNKILASISSPEVPSQVNSIEYVSSDGTWKSYDGDALEILPGQIWKFRVKFTASETDTVTMTMRDISAKLREIESTTAGSSDETQSSPSYTPVTEDDMLTDMLLVKVNEKDDFKVIDVKGTTAELISETVDSSCKAQNSPQYTYVYEIKMSEEAGNKYMDKALSFILEVGFPLSDDGAAEG